MNAHTCYHGKQTSTLCTSAKSIILLARTYECVCKLVYLFNTLNAKGPRLENSTGLERSLGTVSQYFFVIRYVDLGPLNCKLLCSLQTTVALLDIVRISGYRDVESFHFYFGAK